MRLLSIQVRESADEKLKYTSPLKWVYYKSTHLKQYHKEGRALHTETAINNAYDFGVGRRLKSLPALLAIGFAATTACWR